MIMLVLLMAHVTPSVAQEQFYTQSGGRGLQNAKMSARVSKVEGDVKDVQTELAKVQPFAKTAISNCAGEGDKLRWTGNDWLCDSETDPTVQAFAKKALPTCGAGQILSASGSEFTCSNSGYLSAETDPTVQSFAKSPLPNCGTGEVLTSSGSGLGCATDERGLTKETDPLVHAFARTDTATVQNCPAGQVLSMVGNRLQCVFDAVGITVETDPTVQDWTKNAASGGYTLAACAAGEILNAATVGGKLQLQCQAGSAALGPIISATKLDDLADVNASGASADDVLRFDGSNWVKSSDKIGTTTNTKWCYFTASEIVCDRDTPAPMPGASCATGEVVSWDNTGKVWTCKSIAANISETLALDELVDVTISGATTGQGLTYNGSGWVNGYNTRIANYDTDVRTIDSSGGSGAAQIVVDGTALLTAIGTQVGIRTASPNADLDVLGTISSTNLRFAGWLSGPAIQATSNVSAGAVYTSGTAMVSGTTYTDALRVNGDAYVKGNFYVSGSQSFDGVTFANGGVSATGTISATRFVGDGSGLTGVAGGDIIISGTSFAQVEQDRSITVVTAGSQRAVFGENGNVGINTAKPNATLEVNGDVSATNLRVSGNLYVSGTQTIDGVVFANGGVSATGTISATRFVGDGSGLSGIDKDRIVSGTSNVTVENNGSVTISTAGGQRMVVGDGGDVAIGKTTAKARLDVRSSASGKDVLRLENTSGGYLARVYDNSSAGLLSLYDNAGTERIRLATNANSYVNAPAANFGIGTASPNAKLEVNGDISATNLRLSGNLYVSGTQSIDGVIFANGGVSATGGISATYFSGDGSLLAGVTAASMDWYGLTRVPAQVVAVSDGTAIQMAGISSTNVSVTGNVTANGVTGATATFTSVAANSGSFGNINATGYVSAGTINTSGTARVSGTTYSDVLRSVGNSYVGQDLYVKGALYVSGSQSIDGVIFANGGVSATGGISATYFSGDGSGLTGVIAASGDRIVSGTTDMRAIGATGYISLTQDAGSGAANTGWFSPYTGLVTIGVSSTGPISGTDGYFSGLVRMGTDTGTAKGDNNLIRPTATSAFLNLKGGTGRAAISLGNDDLHLFSGQFGDTIFHGGATNSTDIGSEWMRLTGGQLGIGTASPNAKLDVYGDISATNFRGGTFYGDGSGLTNINANAIAGLNMDRIVSGTSNVLVAQNGSVTINTAGSQRMIVGANGNIGIGTVTPGYLLTVGGALAVTANTNVDINPQGVAGDVNALRFSGYRSLFGYDGSDGNAVVQGASGKGIEFNVNNGTFGSGTVAVITSGGNVGIGTTAPSATLEVAGGSVLINNNKYYQTRDSGGLLVNLLGVASNNVANIIAGSNGLNVLASNQSTSRLFINSSGNVGLGTTAPSGTVHVSGTLMVAGGTGAETCDASSSGLMRKNKTTGELQVCQ